MLHLLVVAMLVIGWMSGTLVRVGLGLCVLYGVTVLLMLALQRHHEQRWRDVADVLEELTTTWYFGTALIVLWLLSPRIAKQCLAGAGGAGYPGRARRGPRYWRKIKSYITLRLNIAYAR
ncbi:putative inner membrane protein [Salmonella enterica subsp. enterica serovar Pullorum]|nr:putative inner membrane protein [Salmonella enterica subsp. enterica serovar Pullorum]